MNTVKKNATFAVVLGALTALFPSIAMADVNGESAALEGETDTSVEELSTRDLCEDFCQAEYIDCLDYEPRGRRHGGYSLPRGLRRSECHRRYRRCSRRCDNRED